MDKTLEDLWIPIAKIRMVTNLLDINRYNSDHECNPVTLEGQSLVGSHYTLMDAIDEIEDITRQERDKWLKERDRFRETINSLKLRIAELEGGSCHEKKQ